MSGGGDANLDVGAKGNYASRMQRATWQEYWANSDTEVSPRSGSGFRLIQPFLKVVTL